jgi:hypothetical protein
MLLLGIVLRFEHICLIFNKTNTLTLLRKNLSSTEYKKIKLTQVAKNHFAFATALLWHYSFEIT